ncbi:NUDIX hydrolase [Streptomyces sp. NPDC006999]|uniref:NUDIX hydrolase n=1 Tax=unclassified Streptomyces TaxID=2593676 RepID=UPI00340EC6CD
MRHRLRSPARQCARDCAGPAHRETRAAGGPSVSESPHLLIADVAQVLLRSNGTALCVRRNPGTALAPGQLTVVGGHLEADEPLDHAARREATSGTIASTQQPSRTSVRSPSRTPGVRDWTSTSSSAGDATGPAKRSCSG